MKIPLVCIAMSLALSACHTVRYDGHSSSGGIYVPIDPPPTTIATNHITIPQDPTPPTNPPPQPQDPSCPCDRYVSSNFCGTVRVRVKIRGHYHRQVCYTPTTPIDPTPTPLADPTASPVPTGGETKVCACPKPGARESIRFSYRYQSRS